MILILLISINTYCFNEQNTGKKSNKNETQSQKQIADDKQAADVTQAADAKTSELALELAKLGFQLPKDELASIDFTINDLKGKPYTLSALKGKIVLLNLWATWCAPCRAEMPSMQEIYTEFAPKGLEILAVDMQEEKSKVERFVESNKYTFPVLMDPENKVAQIYSTGSIPTTYLINKKGFIIGRLQGSIQWNTPDMKKLMHKLLETS